MMKDERYMQAQVRVHGIFSVARSLGACVKVPSKKKSQGSRASHAADLFWLLVSWPEVGSLERLEMDMPMALRKGFPLIMSATVLVRR